jgi:hypothetical protein
LVHLPSAYRVPTKFLRHHALMRCRSPARGETWYGFHDAETWNRVAAVPHQRSRRAGGTLFLWTPHRLGRLPSTGTKESECRRHGRPRLDPCRGDWQSGSVRHAPRAAVPKGLAARATLTRYGRGVLTPPPSSSFAQPALRRTYQLPLRAAQTSAALHAASGSPHEVASEGLGRATIKQEGEVPTCTEIKIKR